MHRDEASVYVCPETLEPLTLEVEQESGADLADAAAVTTLIDTAERWIRVQGVPA